MEEQPNTYTDSDQERDASVYLFLLNSLTDLGIAESGQKPNEYKITKQWGQNRIFIRRVLRSVMPELYEEREREAKVPGLSIGKLVDILSSIQDYWQRELAKNKDLKNYRIVSDREKKRALQEYYRLRPEEIEKLGLYIPPDANLLDRLKETITDETRGLSDIANFYKQAIVLYTSLKQESQEARKSNSFLDPSEMSPELIEHIHSRIETTLEQYYPKASSEFKNERIKTILDKVFREFSRTEFQSGIRQMRAIAPQAPDFVENNLRKDISSSSFLENLTDSIAENEIVGDDLPIYIDRVEMERVKPLPLSLYQGNIGLLNSEFIDDEDENSYYYKGLEKQTAYKIKVHFYLYTPETWKPNLEEDIRQFYKKEESRNRFEFCQEIVGIGSPISHVITAINKFLFEGIALFNDKGYFPIAQKVLSEDRVIGNVRNSSVLSYSIVKLCKKKDIEISIKNDREYNLLVADNELAIGEYYGFDLLESATKAALYARLRAIQQSDINCQEYLVQLCTRVEEQYRLSIGDRYLYLYPFSLRTMQDYLEINLFAQKYREWNGREFREAKNGQAWSLAAYEAHLKIAQVYLQEGLYRIGKRYLDAIEPHIKNKRLNDKLLLGLYYMCLFDYHFQTDLEDSERSHEQRGSAIRKSEEYLHQAEKYLQDYLQDHAVIGEYSQTNAHPFFYYLSRIYAHRAKIYIFFPHLAEPSTSKRNGLLEPIYLLEKARIYAARDGGANYYAYWTVYQLWCYLITAYLGDSQPVNNEFSRTNCIAWSKRLIESALDCYAERGKISYQQIKDNSGKRQTEYNRQDSSPQKIWFYEKYGNIFVQTIPPIVEIEESTIDPYFNLQDIEQKIQILKIYTSVLTYTNSDSNRKVYLFGTYSSILLFGLGLVELCDEVEKLEDNLVMATRRFTMCAAIASEGTHDIKEQNNLYLQRIFSDGDDGMPEDFQIRGLYPHRLTQFASLGKIFAAASRVILWSHNSKYKDYRKEIVYLLEDLHDREIIKRPQNPDYALGQTRYNGHLDGQFTRVKAYLERYLNQPQNFSSLAEIRDRIVTDVFKILREDRV